MLNMDVGVASFIYMPHTFHYLNYCNNINYNTALHNDQAFIVLESQLKKD